MSLLRDFYYDVKPFLPLRLRMAVRRAIARAQLGRSRDRWPILPAAGTAPTNWTGWPGGKKFAFVLTHDVESQRGLDHCESLLALERELGFRSSFNFIPEGSYKVSQPLLDRIKSEGFEVGVHDLHHNGKLYRTKKRFGAAAPRINKYLRDWGAVGFRSGFMHRNLPWLHALDIAYDMSTFDTDPFEPQPEGAHTIFPFWVPKPNSTQHSDPALNSGSESFRTSNFEPRTSGSGYAELPYTLPQDSTLFLLLRESDISIWKKKIDWIAERGGMALINVHPDYINFREGSNAGFTFPSRFYRDLLNYVTDSYAGDVACLLPREVAAHVVKATKKIPNQLVAADH